VSTKGLGCVFRPDAKWLDRWIPRSRPCRAWHIDSDETQVCVEVSIQSGYLFQSLVLISEDASKVSTKGWGCKFWPDAEWWDSQGHRCKLYSAPGIILKGPPTRMRSSRRDITLCAPFDPSRTLARCWKGCLGRCLAEIDACVHSLRPWYIDSDETQACTEVRIQSGYMFESLILISEDASTVSTKGLECVCRPDAKWLDSQRSVSTPFRAWHIDSDKTQACVEVSIQSDYLFQSLVLISEDAQRVNTKDLECVFWPDVEWLDSRGPTCKLVLAPGVILKGAPACMRSSRRDFTLCAPFDPSLTHAKSWKGCLRRCLVEFDDCVHSLRPWYIDYDETQACAEVSIQSGYMFESLVLISEDAQTWVLRV